MGKDVTATVKFLFSKSKLLSSQIVRTFLRKKISFFFFLKGLNGIYQWARRGSSCLVCSWENICNNCSAMIFMTWVSPVMGIKRLLLSGAVSLSPPCLPPSPTKLKEYFVCLTVSAWQRFQVLSGHPQGQVTSVKGEKKTKEKHQKMWKDGGNGRVLKQLQGASSLSVILFPWFGVSTVWTELILLWDTTTETRTQSLTCAVQFNCIIQVMRTSGWMKYPVRSIFHCEASSSHDSTLKNWCEEKQKAVSFYGLFSSTNGTKVYEISKLEKENGSRTF